MSIAGRLRAVPWDVWAAATSVVAYAISLILTVLALQDGMFLLCFGRTSDASGKRIGTCLPALLEWRQSSADVCVVPCQRGFAVILLWLGPHVYALAPGAQSGNGRRG